MTNNPPPATNNPPAATNNPPAAIRTLIEAHIKGFNTQDSDIFQDLREHRHHRRRHCALSLVEPQCSGQVAR